MFDIYDYVDEDDVNTIKEWATELGPDRGKFKAKINMLRTAGSDLPPKLLSDTHSPHIKKLRFYGLAKIQWRPMLCKGPVNNNEEFTILLGAHEKGFRLIPEGAEEKAETLRQNVIANPMQRRCPHE